MKKALTLISAVVAFCATTALAQAAPCAPSMTFTTGQTLTAAVLNSNPVTFSGCFSNIDYTNIGAAGIFASQMTPTSSAQATFGGGQNYTFTNNLTVGGTLTAAVLGGLYPSAIAPTTTGQGTFGGSVPITFPNGVTSQAAIQQKVGATTYTLPYDANSTSGSTNTHIEHGVLTTASYSSNFACAASTNFAKAFTTQPDIIATQGGSFGADLYVNAESTTAFQVCSYASGGSGTVLFHWIAIGT